MSLVNLMESGHSIHSIIKAHLYFFVLRNAQSLSNDAKTPAVVFYATAANCCVDGAKGE